MRDRSLSWWYWLATAALLAGALLAWPAGLAVTMAFVALQGGHFAARAHSLRTFPAQTRAAYLAILVAGTWPPLAFLHWLQLAGTCGMLAFDYCVLARVMSLLPWNRARPLSVRLVWRTFASRPMRGSVLGMLG
jgi:hypothetical protein